MVSMFCCIYEDVNFHFLYTFSLYITLTREMKFLPFSLKFSCKLKFFYSDAQGSWLGLSFTKWLSRRLKKFTISFFACSNSVYFNYFGEQRRPSGPLHDSNYYNPLLPPLKGWHLCVHLISKLQPILQPGSKGLQFSVAMARSPSWTLVGFSTSRGSNMQCPLAPARGLPIAIRLKRRLCKIHTRISNEKKPYNKLVKCRDSQSCFKCGQSLITWIASSQPRNITNSLS